MDYTIKGNLRIEVRFKITDILISEAKGAVAVVEFCGDKYAAMTGDSVTFSIPITAGTVKSIRPDL